MKNYKYLSLLFIVTIAMGAEFPIIKIGFYGWKSLVFTGVIATAFIYTVQSFAQTEITSSNIGIIYSFEPVFSAVLSSIMLSERIGFKGIIGGLFIVSSALIYNI